MRLFRSSEQYNLERRETAVDCAHLPDLGYNKYGRQTNDTVLLESARNPAKLNPPVCLIRKLGGERFLIVCPGRSSEALAERHNRAVASEPITVSNDSISTTWSLHFLFGKRSRFPPAASRSKLSTKPKEGPKSSRGFSGLDVCGVLHTFHRAEPKFCSWLGDALLNGHLPENIL